MGAARGGDERAEDEMDGLVLLAIVVGVPLLIGVAIRSWWWALACPGAVLLIGSLIALGQENDPEMMFPARTFVFILTFIATALVALGAFVGTLIGCARQDSY